jgi:predicted dehydrogenase
MSAMRVALIGCGNIAGPYAQDLKTYAEIELVGAADIDAARASIFAAQHGIHAYKSVEALLADPSVSLVVNLTSHFAHKDVTTRALNAGKHVYSEKPLALTYTEAHELVNLADRLGLRLGCSPFTLMGEAQQTAWKLIREGKLGTVRAVFAEVNWGRIESWHPAPVPFYEVGAMFDVGVYPLTILVAMFGPARRVTSYGQLLYPQRVTKEGQPFEIRTPDFIVTMLELAGGTVARLTTDFYVGHHTKQVGIEFHGDAASLYLESWFMPSSKIEFAEFGGSYSTVPLQAEPPEGVRWGLGIADMVRMMASGRPHRFTGEMAAHIVDILESSRRSMETERPVTLQSGFTPPEPLDWAK